MIGVLVITHGNLGGELIRAAELIKGSLDALTPAYTDAEMEFNNGKYLTAKTKFEGVMNQAKSIQDEIAAAVARKAGK